MKCLNRAHQVHFCSPMGLFLADR